MCLDDLIFLVCKFSRFIKDSIRNIDLAYVMKRRRTNNVRDELGIYLGRVISLFLQTFNNDLYVS